MTPTTDARPALFAEYTRQRRDEIDAALERLLRSLPAAGAVIADAMRYSLMSGGKRLRPILTLAAAEAVAHAVDRPATAARSAAEARRRAMPAAGAMELNHTYSLTHDDLPAMDNDSLRRGRPALHVMYDEAVAMLAGDAMLAESFALVAREPTDGSDVLADRKLRVIAVLGAATGPGGMAGGQAADLRFTGRLGRPDAGSVVPLSELQAMHERKTGALIRAAALAGGIMAGGSAAHLTALDAFAREIGLVFQIVDDILDEEGDAGQLGKTAGKDRAAGKVTVPALVGLARAREMAREGQRRAGERLRQAGLQDNWLVDISRWVLERRC
jgi:geranylgeranyl diphosphate synthase type II